jgi:hypothetical protein
MQKKFEKEEDRFKFQFPFEEGEKPFVISPPKVSKLNKTISVNMHKELPMIFDL